MLSSNDDNSDLINDEYQLINKAQNILKKALNDPITLVLLKNSNITRIQFETLIIDLLIDFILDKKVPFKEKTLFRSQKVSRGSFSRTLGQARSRVISSIYTIILLNYVGIFDSKPLAEYELLSEKLKDYITNLESNDKRNKIILKRMEEELYQGIQLLSKPKTFKKV